MAATLLSAAVTCVVSLALGQAALRLSGASEWSWLAPPVGLSVAMLVSAIALWAPGGCTTVAVVLAAMTVAAAVWCGRAPAHRPPLTGLLAALPVAILLLVPFLTVGHAGILGVSFNNDTAAHLLISEHYLSPSTVPELAPAGYPIAPHGMVAVISRVFGLRVDHAFIGWSMALPLLGAWTALALAAGASWPRRAVAATVVGMPFLVAAYYGEGAFKEVLQALLVMASAFLFAGYGPAGLARGRWVPLALVVGGIVSVYSVPGLPWPVAFAVLWLTVTAALRIRRAGTAGLMAEVSRELPAIGIGLAVLVVSLLPQVTRIWEFAQDSGGAGLVPGNALGNLAGPLPFWEGLGVWNNPDFRLPLDPASTGRIWIAFAVALVLLGAAWSLWRRRWMLPLAAGGTAFIWLLSDRSQSPYVTAKALVILSPLLLALAVLPLVEQAPDRLPRSAGALLRRPQGQWLSWGLAALLGLVLFLRVGLSDAEALRYLPVGPTTHTDELRDLRPSLRGEPTLFLGNDDFVRWELAGVPVQGPVIALPELPTRPGKPWSYGEALDFDSVGARTVNDYDWIVTTRDAAGSAPPAGVRLVRTTPSFALWHRDRSVAPHSILAEGEMPGAILRCRTPAGRAVLQGGGVAAVRPAPVVAPGALLGPGGSASVRLPLGSGRWQLQSSYVSRFPIEVTAPGLDVTVPASLDRPGPRWPIGQLTVHGRKPTVVTFTVEDPAPASGATLTELGSTVATRVPPGGPLGLRRQDRLVPVRRACGRYVDWYRAAGG